MPIVNATTTTKQAPKPPSAQTVISGVMQAACNTGTRIYQPQGVAPVTVVIGPGGSKLKCPELVQHPEPLPNPYTWVDGVRYQTKNLLP